MYVLGSHTRSRCSDNCSCVIDCSMTHSGYICQSKHENPKAVSVCCHGMCAVYNIVVCGALLCCVVVCYVGGAIGEAWC